MARPPPDDPRPEAAAGPTGEEIEEPEDPESSPAIPAASLAVHAAAPSRLARRETDREIWTLAWPVILSQTLASAVSLIDIAMLGRLGPEALAAVGYTTQFFWLGQSVLFAVGMACVALMARALGAGDPRSARAALGASLALAVGVSSTLVGAVIVFPDPLLAILNAEPSVSDLAIPYLRLTLASTLLFSISITIESGFRAAKNTRTPMQVAAVATVVKTGLNALLIFGPFGLPRLELVGAGLATVGAQLVAVALLLAGARRSPLREALWIRAGDGAAARGSLGAVARIAAPAVAERLVLNGALMTYFALLASYGPAALAAYTVGVRVLSFSWIPGTGFAAAAATLVGHAAGAQDASAAIRAGWRATRLALGVSTVLGTIYALARLPLARLFTNDPTVIAHLSPFMLLLALAQPLLGIHFTLAGALRGAGDTVTPLLAATLGNWGFRVPLAFLFARALETDVAWVWGALVFDHLARVAWLALAFQGGRWHRKGLGRSPRTPTQDGGPAR